jgi:hypothetical protein
LLSSDIVMAALPLTQDQIRAHVENTKEEDQKGNLTVTKTKGAQCPNCHQWWLYTTANTCGCCTGVVGCIGCTADTCWDCRQRDIAQFGADENCAERKLSKRCQRCQN